MHRSSKAYLIPSKLLQPTVEVSGTMLAPLTVVGFPLGLVMLIDEDEDPEINMRAIARGPAMKLTIFLDIPSYDCLQKRISLDAPSRAALNAAGLLGNTRVVECDDMEARELLFCAISHCPAAVGRLAEAIRAAGLIP